MKRVFVDTNIVIVNTIWPFNAKRSSSLLEIKKTLNTPNYPRSLPPNSSATYQAKLNSY